MKVLTLPVVAKRNTSKGLTAIELDMNGTIITAFAKGDESANPALLATVVMHEIGDTFKALNDSKKLDDKGKPLYKQGDIVKRQTESFEFKQFAGANQAAQFAQAANAFGLKLVVQM